MGRNPKANVFVPFILGLALIESLVIYGLIIAFQLAGKA
jgi:F0F1-type ATP synthase membrane subunit c/vacuolar-type H+-ATPase subunit K